MPRLFSLRSKKSKAKVRILGNFPSHTHSQTGRLLQSSRHPQRQQSQLLQLHTACKW
jgi:hypothetical protein